MERAQIRHVAELAELSLTEAEEEKMAAEIGRILAFAKELDAVDTADVPPTAHVAGIVPKAAGDGWRPDEPIASLSHDDALAQAPNADHGGFSVPTFVES